MNSTQPQSTDILNDTEVISRILQGEKYLYEWLIRKYNTRLYRISMAILNNDMEAEDVMQTAYINAYRNLSGFRNNSSFATWLTRILINESILRQKKIRKSQQVLSEQVVEDLHNETPLKSMMDKELKGLLEKAVANLPEKYRLVFVMREIQELSTHETMEALELGESNVKIRLTRAKEMLREELSSYYKSNELFEFNLIRCDRIAEFVMQRI